MAVPSLKTICVFCSSSSDVSEIYKDIAARTGAFCAEKGWNVVYGGAVGGLMGIMADKALAGGSHVTGVMPECLSNQERAHKNLSRLIITKTLHERQAVMADLADVFVVLPGGLGTLAEFFEVLTWKQIGLHDKPIFLMNADGYWDDLLSMMNFMEGQHFLHDALENLVTIIHTPEDLRQISQI